MKPLIVIAAMMACSGAWADDPWEELDFNCVGEDGDTTTTTFWRHTGNSVNAIETYKGNRATFTSSRYELAVYFYKRDKPDELFGMQKIDRSTGVMMQTSYLGADPIEWKYNCELRPENKF